MYTREDVYAGSLLRLLNLVRQNSDRKEVVGKRKTCPCIIAFAQIKLRTAIN